MEATRRPSTVPIVRVWTPLPRRAVLQETCPRCLGDHAFTVDPDFVTARVRCPQTGEEIRLLVDE